MDYQLHHRVITWIEQAAEKLRHSLQEDRVVEEKASRRDVVTDMDKGIEAFLVERIQAHYPDHFILAEEGTGNSIDDLKGYVWIIDPIDGTMNYVQQKNNFGTMMALFKDGEPLAGYIYDIMNHDFFYGIVGDGVYRNHQPWNVPAITGLSDCLILGNVFMFIHNKFNEQGALEQSLGVRNYGSAAISTLSVLKGEAGAYLCSRLSPWDFAAGWAIFEAAGLRYSRLNGEPLNLLEKSTALLAHPQVYNDLMNTLKTD
ncbi:inositol monophosphatase family protein [Dolosicoccus paucivorans]